MKFPRNNQGFFFLIKYMGQLSSLVENSINLNIYVLEKFKLQNLD